MKDGQENVNHHSENSKIDKVGDDYVAKTPNSVFREKCLTRRLRRRFQRFIQKRKVLKAKQEMKFSMICAVGNPALPISGKEGFVKLFLMMVGEAWNLFVKIGGLIIKFLKTRATSLIKLLMKYPYFSMFTVFTSCALLLINHLARKFGRKLRWYDRLIIIILSLLATWLMSALIKAEAFKTIIEWLNSILIQIILILRSFTSSIDSYTQDRVDKPKPSKAQDFKVFVFFSVLTALTTRYLLSVFKRKVVGDGPLSNELINILELEIDLSDYLPKVSRNSC